MHDLYLIALFIFFLNLSLPLIALSPSKISEKTIAHLSKILDFHHSETTTLDNKKLVDEWEKFCTFTYFFFIANRNNNSISSYDFENTHFLYPQSLEHLFHTLHPDTQQYFDMTLISISQSLSPHQRSHLNRSDWNTYWKYKKLSMEQTLYIAIHTNPLLKRLLPIFQEILPDINIAINKMCHLVYLYYDQLLSDTEQDDDNLFIVLQSYQYFSKKLIQAPTIDRHSLIPDHAEYQDYKHRSFLIINEPLDLHNASGIVYNKKINQYQPYFNKGLFAYSSEEIQSKAKTLRANFIECCVSELAEYQIQKAALCHFFINNVYFGIQDDKQDIFDSKLRFFNAQLKILLKIKQSFLLTHNLEYYHPKTSAYLIILLNLIELISQNHQLFLSYTHIHKPDMFNQVLKSS